MSSVQPSWNLSQLITYQQHALSHCASNSGPSPTNHWQTQYVYVYRDKKNFVHVATLEHIWHQFKHTGNRVLKLTENFQICNLTASPDIQVNQSASDSQLKQWCSALSTVSILIILWNLFKWYLLILLFYIFYDKHIAIWHFCQLHLVTVHFGPSEEDGSSVSKWEVYSGQHPMSKRTWDTGFVEVINKGDKPGHCASRGKEMQITQIQSVEVLHPKLRGEPVETRWCIVLFIKCIWFSIIWSLKWHYFV
jgi:hypothetical protein